MKSGFFRDGMVLQEESVESDDSGDGVEEDLAPDFFFRQSRSPALDWEERCRNYIREYFKTENLWELDVYGGRTPMFVAAASTLLLARGNTPELTLAQFAERASQGPIEIELRDCLTNRSIVPRDQVEGPYDIEHAVLFSAGVQRAVNPYNCRLALCSNTVQNPTKFYQEAAAAKATLCDIPMGTSVVLASAQEARETEKSLLGNTTMIRSPQQGFGSRFFSEYFGALDSHTIHNGVIQIPWEVCDARLGLPVRQGPDDTSTCNMNWYLIPDRHILSWKLDTNEIRLRHMGLGCMKVYVTREHEHGQAPEERLLFWLTTDYCYHELVDYMLTAIQDTTNVADISAFKIGLFPVTHKTARLTRDDVERNPQRDQQGQVEVSFMLNYTCFPTATRKELIPVWPDSDYPKWEMVDQVPDDAHLYYGRGPRSGKGARTLGHVLQEAGLDN